MNNLSIIIYYKNPYKNSDLGRNYLSNKIFYRIAKLRKELRLTLATGHFHISKLQDERVYALPTGKRKYSQK